MSRQRSQYQTTVQALDEAIRVKFDEIAEIDRKILQNSRKGFMNPTILGTLYAVYVIYKEDASFFEQIFAFCIVLIATAIDYRGNVALDAMKERKSPKVNELIQLITDSGLSNVDKYIRYAAFQKCMQYSNLPLSTPQQQYLDRLAQEVRPNFPHRLAGKIDINIIDRPDSLVGKYEAFRDALAKFGVVSRVTNTYQYS